MTIQGTWILSKQRLFKGLLPKAVGNRLIENLVVAGAKNKLVVNLSSNCRPVVISVQKVLSAFGHEGRLCLLGKYIDHRLVARS